MSNRDELTCAEELALQLKDFFEKSAVCQRGIQPLGDGVEIGVVVENHVSCALYHSGDRCVFEIRHANTPDVIFKLTSAGVSALVEFSGADVGQLGITVLEQYIAQNVRISVPGNVFTMMTRGYLGIIKLGGAEFARYLAKHGVSSLSKIPGIIKDLKKNS